MSDSKFFDLDEFIDFLFSVYDFSDGGGPEIKCQASTEIEATNKVNDSIIVDKIYNSLTKHTSKIDQKIVSSQKVNIICGDENTRIDPLYLEYRDRNNTFFGNQTNSSGCITGGCCPSVHQISKLKLAAIQNTALDESVSMVTDIVSAIEQETNLEVGCGAVKKKKEVNMEVNKQTIDEADRLVRNLIQKEIDTDLSVGQTVTIHVKSPLLCSNECGEEPSSSTITQEINIRVLASNIVGAVKETIDKTKIVSRTKTEQNFSVDAGSSLNSFKGYIYSILTVLITIIISILYYVLAGLVMNLILYYLFKGQVRDIDDFFPKGSQYAVAALLFYITILIWNFIICVFYEKNSLFYCTMGRTWKEYIKEWTDYIVCMVKKFIKWVTEFVLEMVLEAIGFGGGAMGFLDTAFDVAYYASPIGQADAAITMGTALANGENPIDAMKGDLKNKNKCLNDENIDEIIEDLIDKLFVDDTLKKCEPVK